MRAILHVELPAPTAQRVLASLSPDSVDTTFEKRASTAYAQGPNGVFAVVDAQDAQALNASLHFAVKNISFLLTVESFARRF
jgi:tRNA threonylcarbamoyladenosine modification (KEOPS) complex  Pcc1 subunit